MRLRCYLFSKLVREGHDRLLDTSEKDFCDRHRLECESCRIKELTTLGALEDLRTSTAPAPSHLSTEDILNRLKQANQND